MLRVAIVRTINEKITAMKVPFLAFLSKAAKTSIHDQNMDPCYLALLIPAGAVELKAAT